MTMKRSTALKAFGLVACCAIAGTLLGLAVTRAMGARQDEEAEQSTRMAKGVTQTISADAKRLLKMRAFPTRDPLLAQEAADRIRRMTTYRGTRINPKAKDNLPFPQVRKAFTDALRRLDPLPESRVQHFDWIVGRDDLNTMGWRGFVSGIEQVPGGWVVEIRVMPDFQPAGGIVQTPDQCVERYAFSAAGRIDYIPFAHEHPSRGALMYD
jgi:hypothetical protein